MEGLNNARGLPLWEEGTFCLTHRLTVINKCDVHVNDKGTQWLSQESCNGRFKCMCMMGGLIQILCAQSAPLLEVQGEEPSENFGLLLFKALKLLYLRYLIGTSRRWKQTFEDSWIQGMGDVIACYQPAWHPFLELPRYQWTHESTALASLAHSAGRSYNVVRIW